MGDIHTPNELKFENGKDTLGPLNTPKLITKKLTRRPDPIQSTSVFFSYYFSRLARTLGALTCFINAFV